MGALLRAQHEQSGLTDGTRLELDSSCSGDLHIPPALDFNSVESFNIMFISI